MIKTLFSTVFALCLLSAIPGCEAEDPTTVAPDAPVEELAEADDAITLSCGTLFDCRAYPPSGSAGAGRTWLFRGSKYCNTSGFISCQFQPSGLSSSYPTTIVHQVPSTCRSCISNNSRSSTCSNSNVDISSFTWTCNLGPTRSMTPRSSRLVEESSGS